VADFEGKYHRRVNDLDAANYHYEESGAAHTAAYLFEPTLR
jgi:hypothetical protein